MRLRKNAGALCLQAWSMWANYLGVLALVLPEVIYVVLGVDTDPTLWGWAGLALILAGIVGRVVDQGIEPDTTRSPALVVVIAVAVVAALLWGDVTAPEPQPRPVLMSSELAPDAPIVRPQARPGTPSAEDAALDVVVPLVAKWEGLRRTAYQDIVGVWTVCYGETRGVQPGDRYTKAQCLEKLRVAVADYRAGLRRYFTPETRAVRLPPTRDAAYTSLAYNVGVAGAGKSTAVRRLNAGDIKGGCEAIGWWNKAGGRVVRGLVNRRAEEVALCLQGLRS